MIKGLYAATVGMTAQQKKMDTVTNNLANVDTVGYKKDGIVHQSFSETFVNIMNDPQVDSIFDDRQIGKVGMGVFVQHVYTDFSTGTMEVTDGALDLSVRDEGYFTVNMVNDDGETVPMYTRDGTFDRDPDGYLINKAGYRVQGTNGDIQLPEGIITIDANGVISVQDEVVDQLQMTNFTDQTTLRKYGENLYTTTDESEMTDFTGSVLQGTLELSNVNSVQEMVEMITLSRTYEANQKMITTCDSSIEKAVSSIASKA